MKSLRELKELEVGDAVFWPEGGAVYVQEILTDTGQIEHVTSPLVVTDASGISTEIFAYDLLVS